MLLLGDPGTAKSQLLQVRGAGSAPHSAYTSGKGQLRRRSDGQRDPRIFPEQELVVEAEAMVLADGGVVCIDEFDEMRDDRRVAIQGHGAADYLHRQGRNHHHLNSRCSILAMANSVSGRWDDTKAEENIDSCPPSTRFDTIFIVKDEHDEART